MLQFDGIREYVIVKLDLCDDFLPVERIAIARRYTIPGWQFEPFVALARRDDPLSVKEAMQLGVENMALLAKAREMLRSSATYACLRCGSSGRGAMVTASSQAASGKHHVNHPVSQTHRIFLQKRSLWRCLVSLVIRERRRVVDWSGLG